MNMPTFVTDRLTTMRAERVVRAERARLREQLESYRTPAERNELDAILSRHTAEDLEQLEQASGWRAA